MSRLEALINEFCPNGVEYKHIQECILFLNTGLNPRQNFVLNETGANCPYITGKDIYENRINVSDRTDMIRAETVTLINKRANLQDDVLLFASTGTGTVGRMALIDKYDGTWNVSETLYCIKTGTQDLVVVQGIVQKQRKELLTGCLRILKSIWT